MRATVSTASLPATDLLAPYLREIGTIPLLTAAEEVELARRARDGDEEALQRLVAGNLRFVVSVAKRYRNQGLPFADVIEEGNLGLLHAAGRFDETRGIRFISYAVWWVRQSIIRALSEQARVVRLPTGRAAVVQRVARQASVLGQRLGREPTLAELGATVPLDAQELAGAMRLALPPLSLDAPRGTGDGPAEGELLVDEDLPPADDLCLRHARSEVVAAALASLAPRDASILRLHYGLDDGEPHTLAEIGSRLGITRERVRQIKERAVEQLRVGRHGERLASLA